MKTWKISYWRRLLDLTSPRTCAVCGQRLRAAEKVVCNKCYLHLPRTNHAGNPYENDMAKMFWGRLRVERVAAFFHYESHAETANIIYQLKYKNHPEIGPAMGRMLATELKSNGFFDGIDGIIPVPLTKSRLKQRGYNQSEEIAKGISEMTGVPIYKDVLERTVFKGSQTQRSRWDRNDNVEHVFALRQPLPPQVKHVLMIDDVVTTGATMVACASQLPTHQGLKISILSLGLTKR